MGFTEIYERIKLAANCRTQVELAELLNIRQSSISDAKRRDSVPGDWYMKLFERFGLNPDWLKYGVGPLYLRTEKGYCPQEAPQALAETVACYGGDFTRSTVVDVYDMACAYTDEDPRPALSVAGRVPLPQAFLRPSLQVLRLRGRAMEPLLREGAYIGVDMEDPAPVSGRTYALFAPLEGVVVARCSWTARSRAMSCGPSPRTIPKRPWTPPCCSAACWGVWSGLSRRYDMSISRRHGRVALCGVLCALCCLLLAACGGREPADDVVPGGTVILEPPSANGDGDAGLKERSLGPSPAAPATVVTPAAAPAPGAVRPSAPAVAPAWQELSRRLAADGISGPQVDALLAGLPATPTQSPMGRKIKALYNRKFFPAPPSDKPLAQYYKGVVTDANARLCRRFITANSTAFRQAEQRYGVPSSIAAALLFVETRLGKVLGDTSENAFYTLASMAVSRTPESISDWLPQLRDHAQHMDWIAETMPKRADWAYKETRALVEHMLRDRVPPEHLPGSIYGAVGLCQFMPSNIATYGADGDGDGRVDLFTVPDAVASLSHYLARHGWKAGLSRERQHALLMRYNHSTVYANTILALADRVAALK